MKKATRKKPPPRQPSQPLQAADPDSRPRGARLPQNQVKLRRQASNGQYSITIPAGVAKALRYFRTNVHNTLCWTLISPEASS